MGSRTRRLVEATNTAAIACVLELNLAQTVLNHMAVRKSEKFIRHDANPFLSNGWLFLFARILSPTVT